MPIDPSSLSGKVLWLRAKDLTSGAVSTWTDQSGRLNNATGSGGSVTTGATPAAGQAISGTALSYTVPDLGLGLPLTATASSSFPSTPPSNGVDGSTSSVWSTNDGATLPHWFRVQTDTPTAATSYSLLCRSDLPAQAPRSWTFQGSNDSSTWTTLDTRSGVTLAAGAAQTFTFTNSTAFSFYRLNITENNGYAGGAVGFAEFTLGGIVNTPTPKDAELWVVLKTSGGSGPQSWHYGTSGQASHYTYSGVVYDDTGSNARRSFTPTVDVAAWRLYRVVVSGTVWSAYLDNALQLTASSTKSWTTTPKVLDSFSGQVAEVLFFGRALTGSEPADLITYFNGQHGLTVPGGSSSAITLDGTVAATSATQGDLTVSPALSGQVDVISGAQGTVVANVGISGQVDAVTSAQGDVTASVQIAGQVDATSTVEGVFTSGINVSITGQVDAVSDVQGDLSLAFPVIGQVDAVSDTQGDLSVSLGLTGQVNAVSGAQGNLTGDTFGGSDVSVGVTVETGALTLLHLVALPGVEIPVGLGVTAGGSQAVVPLPGISVQIGCSLIGRQSDVVNPDPRRLAAQWRYVVTDLANMPLGELVDIEHDAVEDGVGEATTMSFTIATDSDQYALIKPIERQCQVWEGDVLRLRGPILPGQPSDDGTTITHKIHDPSWFWRDGRRVITRTPQKNLLHNGDFKSALAWWTRGYDKDSIPAAAPTVRVVEEDFVDDTDGLDPIKAAEIVGVESVTEAELSSNAVFWPNLATFRPGGKASIEAVANAMPTTAGLKVTVVGHTANDGTGNGLGLSLRRAQAAAAIIHAKRPSAVITTKGVGFYDPKPGFPIGSQAQRRVVIQYDQTISGKSKQYMKQTVEVTQPKEARYPLVLTVAAMLKVADDWSIADANMESLKIVARRKGVGGKPDATLPWDEQLGQGSSSISDTDPVDRWIPQTAEATIPADGRTYLVDVYLYAPAALARYTAVGLFPDEQLYFWGQDQALIFKGVMEHIQKPEFGYADLGIATRAPLTGVKRDREFAFRDLTPADTALDGLMGISRGLEWDTVTTPTTTTATTFYPRQGKSIDYVLALGANVVTAVPANTRDVGSAIIAQAQGLGSYRAVAYANDTRAFGGTLIQRVITAEQDTPLNELGETARAELFWARSSTPAYWVDIDPDSIGEVLANTAKGDTVRLILDYPTAVDRLARIVRRQIHPDSLRLMVAFEEV